MLLKILSYDFWGLDTLKVMQLFPERHIKASTLEILAKAGEDYPKLAELAKFFANLSMKSPSAPLEIWLSFLIGELELNGYTSPYLEYYREHLSKAELVEFYENLATLRQHILTHIRNLRPDDNSAPELADLVAMIADYEAAGTEIMRISNFRSAEQAVQVMTAHKSKGLEFQYVFLIAFDNTNWGKSKGNNNKLTLPKNLAKIRHTGITDEIGRAHV